jgi:hypothetical protein
MENPGQPEVCIVLSPFFCPSTAAYLFNGFQRTAHPYPQGFGSITRSEKRPGDVFQSPISPGHLISTSLKIIYVKKGRVG